MIGDGVRWMGSVRTAVAVTSLAVFVAGVAQAQRVEIVPFGGGRFGGSVQNAQSLEKYSLDASVSYGAELEVPLGGPTRLSVLYSRQETEVGATAADAVPVTIQYVHIGGSRDMAGHGAARPFVVGALGLGIATTLDHTSTKFGLSGGLGVRTPSTSRVALRAEARGYATFVGSQEFAGTCGGAGCTIAFQSSVLLQGEVTLGLGFRF